MMSKTTNSGGDSRCPECGAELNTDVDDHVRCTNLECSWIQTDSFSGRPIDASWQTPPWERDGETVDATPNAENGNVETSDWPGSVEVSPDELTDKQERIIRAVARYPDKTAGEIADVLGRDNTPYIYSVIAEHWPERESQIRAEDSANEITCEECGEVYDSKQSYNGHLANCAAGSEDYWPGDAPPREDLNDDQVAILEAAADPEQTFNSASELSQKVTPQRDRSYASNVLSQHSPSCYQSVKKYSRPDVSENDYARDNNSEMSESESGHYVEHVDEVRRRLLGGETLASIAEDFDVSRRPLGKLARGEKDHPPAEIPALEYDKSRSGNKFYIPDEGGENDRLDHQSEETINLSDEPSVELDNTGSEQRQMLKYCAAFVVGYIVARWRGGAE